MASRQLSFVAFRGKIVIFLCRRLALKYFRQPSFGEIPARAILIGVIFSPAMHKILLNIRDIQLEKKIDVAS